MNSSRATRTRSPKRPATSSRTTGTFIPSAGILDAGSSEPKPFGKALEQAAGRKLSLKGFRGVGPHPVAVHILHRNCRAALGNLPNNVPGSLPMLVATKGRFRFEVVHSEVGR